MSQRANLAVVARRSEPPDSLDYFPTPPWATRAFMTELAQRRLFVRGEEILEPACGEGHMAAALAEFSDVVRASDIFPYGYGEVADFLDDGEKPCVDWIITNPPFNKAAGFVERALEHPAAKARIGVAVLVRLAWLEGAERGRFFARLPPNLVLVHSDRVCMTKGRWEPGGTTATAYAWVVWLQAHHARWSGSPKLGWLGPEAKTRFTRFDDAARFGAKSPAPLLEGEKT